MISDYYLNNDVNETASPFMAPSLSGVTELLINNEVAANPAVVANLMMKRTIVITNHKYTRL